MAGFITEWSVSSDLQITLPFTANGTYNAVVDWGDETQSTITSYDDADRIHTYAQAGVYQVEITGSAPGWSFNNSAEGDKCTDVIDWGDAVDFDGFQFLEYGFYGAAVESAGNGPILFDSGIERLTRLFSNTPVQSAPIDLFDNASDVTGLRYAFYQCSSLVGSPPSLAGMSSVEQCDRFCYGAPLTGGNISKMTGCTSLTTLNYAFYNCDGLATMDPLCYEDLTSCIDFNRSHTNCENLQLQVDAFCAVADRGTRFLNQSVDFQYAFYRTSYSGTQGLAPDGWKCDFGTGTPSTANAFGAAGNNSTSLDNYNGIPAAWAGPSTIPDPTVTGIDDTTLEDGQQGVTVSGDTFCYDAEFYLGDASTYAACTTLVLQTLNSVTEVSGNIDIDQGALSDGDAWVYATHYRDQSNSSGYQVTISSGSSVPEGTGAGDNAAQLGAGTGAAVPVGTGTGDNAGQEGTGTGSAVAVGTGAGDNAAQTGTGAGQSVPVGTGTGDNAGQLGTSSGQTVPVGTGTGDNAGQTGAGAGVSIPVGTGAGDNAAQLGSGTGETPSEYPTGTGAGDNAAQLGSGTGVSIQYGTGAGFNAPQLGSGTGETPTDLPTGTGAGENAGQLGSGSGVAVVEGIGSGYNAAQIGLGIGSAVSVGIGFGDNAGQLGSGTGNSQPDLTALNRDFRIIDLRANDAVFSAFANDRILNLRG